MTKPPNSEGPKVGERRVHYHLPGSERRIVRIVQTRTTVAAQRGWRRHRWMVIERSDPARS